MCITNNMTYCYKSSGEFIVKLTKLPDTIDNENRTSIRFREFALYRASHLRVVDIYHREHPDFHVNSTVKEKIEKYESYITYDSGDHLKFVVGEIVYATKFDPNRESIFTDGIWYYLNEECAKNHGLWGALHSPRELGLRPNEPHYLIETMFTGTYNTYHPNGELASVCTYINGKENGMSIYYTPDGNKLSKFNMVDGKVLSSEIVETKKNVFIRRTYLDGELVKEENCTKLN